MSVDLMMLIVEVGQSTSSVPVSISSFIAGSGSCLS
jgi:hypothetical protein